MISKILPAHFIIELNGAATTALLPEAFNIEGIALTSIELQSDLQAFAAGEALLKRLLPEQLVERLEVNPEFYPCINQQPDNAGAEAVEAIEVTNGAEEDEEIEEVELQALGGFPISLNQPPASLLMRVNITKSFDALGDFVQLRKTYGGEGAAAKLRVLANPSMYLKEKVRQHEERHSSNRAHRELGAAPLIQ